MDAELNLRIAAIEDLFEKWSGERPTKTVLMPQSGSNRKYYRLCSDKACAIGAVGENTRENEAFLSFSKALAKAGINVPAIYGIDKEKDVYLQQDLGDTTLYSIIEKDKGKRLSSTVKGLYKKVLNGLFEIQQKGRNAIDFSMCYPRDCFDKQSMMWDMQYFKYYFLKLAGIPFDEEKIERDFDALSDYLSEANCKYFLYRDFQSRNIMIDADGEPWFIDYQGGRKGARQYDVASLLYDAKAELSDAVRNELLSYYVSKLKPNEMPTFLKYFYGYVLIRLMQAMGAYGYRGYFERKAHFLKSIPLALDNLLDIVDNHFPAIEIDELKRVLVEVAHSEKLRRISNENRLKVKVFSFSYKHGIPTDLSGNGGGHVFDCRALPNPGREERYKNSTGKDPDVIEFFDHYKSEMTPFLKAAKEIASISVNNYRKRNFNSLMISFGCTGGQHRSVYCAEQIADWLRKSFKDIDVELKHTESIAQK